MRFKTYLQSLVFIAFSLQVHSIEFGVYFNLDKESKKQEAFLRKKSELFLANSQTYNSIFAIRNQAENDALTIKNTLASQGYLDAKVRVYCDGSGPLVSVVFEISAGNRYLFGNIDYKPPYENPIIESFIGQYISYSSIEELEKELIETLQNQGFFNAKIEETKILIQSEDKASVLIKYEKGPCYYFGSTTIVGLNKVNPLLIENKISWLEDQPFNASLLKALQQQLLDTQLFSQVSVRALEATSGHIPIQIEVVETKFKSVSIGINYQTHFGFGGDLSFEHKNLSSNGQRLNFETTVTQNSILGKINYFIPNFCNESQTLDFKIEAIREELQPSFSDNLYEFSCKFHKTITRVTNYDLGVASRFYQVQHSVQNKESVLAIPFVKFNYDTTYSQLDPKTGIKASIGGLYYQNFINPRGYFSGTFKSAFFYSIWKKRITFAERLFIGTFFTSHTSSIPVPLRFFGGTDEYLRGFKYYTVSPLLNGKPAGGKSTLYLNSEIRITIKYPFGTVLFYDSGFVSDYITPYKNSPYYQTLGFGFRYYAFFGPLRIDIGFPLNRRKELDAKFKVLGSFGHTF